MTIRITSMALAFFLATPMAQMAFASDGDQRISLIGMGGQGTVRFRDRGHNRRLRVEVENLRLPIDTVLIVAIDGKLVGTMKISDRRNARLELRSRGNLTIPVIEAGSVLSVFAPDGSVLMKGTLR